MNQRKKIIIIGAGFGGLNAANILKKEDVDLTIIDKQNQLSVENNRKDIGKIYKVLIEKTSKKSTEDFSGRNSQNKMIVFPRGNAKIGDYVNVLVESITQGTLIGKIV